jgi:hypothetical protein
VARGYIGAVSVVGGVVTAVCLAAMAVTTPLAIGPVGVTVWFLGVLVALSCWLSLAAYVLGRKLQPNVAGAAQIAHAARRGVLLGGFITFIVALSSLKQFSLRDALLLALLLILVEFYMVAKS